MQRRPANCRALAIDIGTKDLAAADARARTAAGYAARRSPQRQAIARTIAHFAIRPDRWIGSIGGDIIIAAAAEIDRPGRAAIIPGPHAIASRPFIGELPAAQVEAIGGTGDALPRGYLVVKTMSGDTAEATLADTVLNRSLSHRVTFEPLDHDRWGKARPRPRYSVGPTQKDVQHFI